MVHLYQAEVFDVALVELGHVAARHRRALDRHGVDERLGRDEHAAVVDRKMSREVRDREGELAEERKARALLGVEELEETGERVRERPGLLPAMLRLTARVLVRGMLRRACVDGGVDVA